MTCYHCKITGLDSIGPQKYAKLSGWAEWLNINYPVNRRAINIVLHNSSVVPADIVHQGIPWIKGTRTVGFFDPTTRPWEIHIAARISFRQLRRIVAHEWYHALVAAGLREVAAAEGECLCDAEEREADSFAVLVVELWLRKTLLHE